MLEKKEIEALYLLNSIEKKHTAVSFSGGKDSLVSLHLSVRAGIKTAVFSDTTIEPKGLIDYVKNISSILNINIYILKPIKTFWELLPLLGPPSTNNRWCCPTLKYYQLNMFAKEKNIKYYITGLRKTESKARNKYSIYGKNPMIPFVTEVNPIIDWTEEEVWNYIEKYSLPVSEEYAQGLNRNGCIFCPYKTPNELEKMAKLEPDEWKKYEEFLRLFAINMQIPDPDSFVKNGWRTFKFPQRKIMIKTNDLINVDISLEKIIDEYTPQKVKKILKEKSVNCIGCGACIPLCSKDALKLTHGKIDVDPNKCSKCYDCTSSKYIREGCISRNYSISLYIFD
ncbi:MAG: phosphoadenosine phosphosulfate reductase family protein [Minisyncoccia bacterium]|jgi:phosphoadenosine phosphosulfate reductase